MVLRFLYSIFIQSYSFLIFIASFFNKKAKLLINGRRATFNRINAFRELTHDQAITWMHCASLGEYEQGRYLIERLKKLYPDKKIVVSFYSPSGFEFLSKHPVDFVDFIFYLPSDTASNMKKLLTKLNPRLFILVKYEFWLNMLSALRGANIPGILISSQFKRDHFIFSFWGRNHYQELSHFQKIFTINEEDKKVLLEHGIQQVQVAGDTRIESSLANLTADIYFDKVHEYAEKFEKVVVYGSIWKDDLPAIEETIKEKKNYLHIIAPHKTDLATTSYLQSRFPENNLWADTYTHNLLIVNTIGPLKHLYRYADLVYIGGGFHKGLHNTLEAAVWEKPLIFGPDYQNFKEAVDFIKKEVAISVNNQDEFRNALTRLITKDPDVFSKSYQSYFSEQKDSTELIIDYIREL